MSVLNAVSPRSKSGPTLTRYAQLTKARLSVLVLMTTGVGYIVGADTGGGIVWTALAGTLVGTALAAGAANALNQVLEIRRDALMDRTRRRPLPSGTIDSRHAVRMAIALAAAGLVVLWTLAGPAPAALALLTIVVYVLLYTPLKRQSSLNTLVGAVCGAIPPMIGWVAATGRLDSGAWALAGLLFVWQLPHFLALAWLYRSDYARGRFRMLPVIDDSGELTCRIVVLTSMMLLPLALVPTLLGLAGPVYAAGSIALGLLLLAASVRLYADRSDLRARRVFLTSILYLSTLLVLMVLDRGVSPGSIRVDRVAVAEQ